MAGTPLARALYCPTVTVTGAAANLLALIRAKGGIYTDCPGSSRNYTLMPDGANSDNILIGDETVALSPQNCGLNMPKGSGAYYSATLPAMAPLGSLYVLAASGSQLLNVIVISE